MKKDSGTAEVPASSSSLSGPTEEPEWLIPKQQQQQLQTDSIGTNSDITKSLFSSGKPSRVATSKAPLIVDMNENPGTVGTTDTADMTQSSTLSELILPLEITSSSSSKTISRPLIEEIDDSVSDSHTDLLVKSSINKEEEPSNFFLTESNVSKAASFYSAPSKEPESTPTEFGGQWAERSQPLIEEVRGDNAAKIDAVKVEVIEDLEDIETSQSCSMAMKPDENGRKETSFDMKSSRVGEMERIGELAEKAGSTLDPVTVDQALLQSLRQKYQ